MWGAWFGGNGGQQRKDAPKKAILALRQQLDMLQKRERHLENQMAKQDEIARENVTTNKIGGQALCLRVAYLLGAVEKLYHNQEVERFNRNMLIVFLP